MSTLISSCHALSVYVNGISISDKTPNEINDKITTTKSFSNFTINSIERSILHVPQ